MNRKQIFVSGIFSGVLIAIASALNCAFLSLNNELTGKFLGSAFFGIGLVLICIWNQWLYTGKVGFIFRNNKSYLKDLLICLAGNFVGAVLIGLICYFSGLNLSLTAETLGFAKANMKLVPVMTRSFLCGVMIYIAVIGYKSAKTNFGKIGLVFISIFIFVFCGFEHCVADMFYLTVAAPVLAQSYGILYAILNLFLIIIFNGLGSIFIDFLYGFTTKKE